MRHLQTLGAVRPQVQSKSFMVTIQFLMNNQYARFRNVLCHLDALSRRIPDELVDLQA